MSFLENITKKVGDAAQLAAKKSGELVEITKINLSIGNEEDKIRDLYIEIGKKVFDNYSSNNEFPEEYKELCISIEERKKTIQELKAKILELRNVRLCISCNNEIDNGSTFCPNCGAKQGD